MTQVVRDPRCKQLAQRNTSELRMLALERKFPLRQIPTTQTCKILLALASELIKELGHALTPALTNLGEPVVGFEAAIGTLSEDDPSTRDPIGALSVNQMAKHVKRTEGIGTFIGGGPGFLEPAEQRSECRGRTLEDRDCVG